MLFGSDRNRYRETIVSAWKKASQGVELDALEQQIVDIVGAHPEYHRDLERKDAITRDFSVESGQVNPFMHLSMHLALREQRNTNRPMGIQSLYFELCKRTGDEHEAEHRHHSSA